MPDLAVSSRLLRARLQLMLSHPYLASAVARLPLREVTAADGCETMATDGYHIFVNPTFSDGLSDEEIQFVLAHELLHCLLGHIDRRGSREPSVWNAAIDYATNGLLVELGWKMPAEGLFDIRFRGMTAEAVYKQLPTSAKVIVRANWPRGRSHRGKTLRAAVTGFDNHLEPTDLLTRANRADMPSVDERRRLRKALTSSIAGLLPGHLAGHFQAEVVAATEAEVPWQHLLARFVTGLRKTDYRWYPFNRKHLWRGFYLPALGVPGPEHLVVAVDTSGSMSNDTLAQVASEIDQLRSVSECRLTVLHSDTVVQKVEVYEAYEGSQLGFGKKRMMMHGRGGTDLRAPFEWLRDQARQGRLAPSPDALIFLTDGFGPMPSGAPEWPVLWLVTKHGIPRVPFGSLVRLSV